MKPTWPARLEPNRLHGWDLQQTWGRMRVWQAGQGPVVIAIHGLGGSGRYWQKLVEPGSFTLVAPDLAGFGQSSKPNLAFDRDFHLANLEDLIDRVSPVRPVILVGHSVGGVLAALWAASHPERVASLALIATPFPGVHPLPPPVRWVKDRSQSRIRRLPISLLRFATYPIVLPLGLLRGNGLSNVRDFTRQSVAARTWTAWSLMADQTAVTELEILKNLPVATKVLLFTGSRDRLVGARDLAGWKALLPSADHLTIAAGHQLLLNGGLPKLATWIREQSSA